MGRSIQPSWILYKEEYKMVGFELIHQFGALASKLSWSSYEAAANDKGIEWDIDEK